MQANLEFLLNIPLLEESGYIWGDLLPFPNDANNNQDLLLRPMRNLFM